MKCRGCSAVSNERAKSATWHSTLGTALVVAGLAGWGVAGAAYLSEAPLVIGAFAGIACGLAGVTLMYRSRR